MPTTVLNAYSKAYPDITNRIRASVFLQSDPQALITTIIDAVVGHPERVWSFPGLPRNNYGFSLDEINISDVVVSNLALFDVVPGEIEGQLIRDDEQIQVGTTPGFVAGAQTFVFDGTSGKPNYVGWEIVPSELTGRGILVEGVDYSWSMATGTLTMLQFEDGFQAGNHWNIHFNPILEPIGNSYPTLSDFSIVLLTSDTSLNAGHAGKKIILEPSGVYMEVTLPNIDTVVEGRPIMFDASTGTDKCIKIKPFGSNEINFLRGSIYIIPNESIIVYKFIRSIGNPEWRVSSAEGNFKTCGTIVSDDAVQADAYNKIILNGSSLLATQYARLYNEFVLNLPVLQVVNYDSWSTGNNKYFYSLANSSNPANAGKFMIPDRRGLFERNNNSGIAGEYYADTFKSHDHYIQTGGDKTIDDRGDNLGYIQGRNNPDGRINPVDMNSPLTYNNPFHFTTVSGETETMPKNYLINKYVLI